MCPLEGGGVAEGQDQKSVYLANARDAEVRASRTNDPVLKEGWRKVAEGYLYLAERLKRPSGGGNP
jgi:hypothetical protein